jgi:SAM-dependent methyltransferase
MTAEQLYSQLREREGRTYSDAEVARLPDVPRSHPHWREWQARTSSARRLCAFLARRGTPLTILELGCGNGWLTGRLARLNGSRTIGVDINQRELAQARRVFAAPASPWFVCADIFAAPFRPRTFDIVVLAAALQYFADPRALVAHLASLLTAGGEVHILDSPLYRDDQVEAAAERSRAHFERLGVPALTAFYHHHRLSDLAPFDPEVIVDPRSLASRWRRIRGGIDSPFPWIRLRPS